MKFPIIYITLLIISGIVSESFINIPIQYLLVLNFLILILLTLSYFISKKTNKYKFIFTFLTFIISFSTGLLSAKRIDKRNFKNHYSHFIKHDTVNSSRISIEKILKTNEYYRQYIGNVISINKKRSFGKIIIKQKLNETNLKPGNVLIILLNDYQFKEPLYILNPFDFDYKKYLYRRGVFHQIFLNKTSFFIDKKNNFHSVYIIAERIRNYIYNKFKTNGLKGNSLSLATAIFLGDRQYLSKETISDFKSAGTIHILAISGLHIGILLLFLNFIFGFVKQKFSVLAFLSVTILFLWFYGFITGFSPSIMRAVIMFTFLQTGFYLKRNLNIYNTLFSAAFFMILFNPEIIYEVGFQMSFAAVFSIVSFYPFLSKYYIGLPKWLSDIFFVSLAAQIGVLPFSLYYFHQFPVYFLLANFFIIPLLFVVLYYGFSIIVLSFIFPHYTNFLFKGFSLLLDLLLLINNKIAHLKYSIIKDIPFNLYELFFSVILVILFYLLIKSRYRFISVVIFASWIILFQTYKLFQLYNKKNEHKLYFLYQYNSALVAESFGYYLTFFDSKKNINSYILKSFKQNYKQISYNSLSFYQVFNSTKILHIDSLGIWKIKEFKPDIIALHYSPKINFERLVTSIRPVLIIADASNYSSYIKRWETTCKSYKIAFIDLNKQGAFILDKKNINVYKLEESNNKGSKSANELDL